MRTSGITYENERLTLEVSLKPFYSVEEEALREVCETLCDNWRPLAKRSKLVAFQLFVGDGDEILNWRGHADDPINWCNTTGCSNMDEPYAYNFVHPQAEERIPGQLPEWTYHDLHRLIRCLKETAREVLGKASIVGVILDSGAEFVPSDFKFRRHPELMGNGKDLGLSSIFGAFVDVTARLQADATPYAAFPDGIPAEGVGFGEFLGKQFRSLSEAIGLDYIWFSNGLGFGFTPWETRGLLFDGQTFRTDRFQAANAEVIRFWREFHEHSGGAPIGIRGSNTSIGMDLSVFGISSKDVYAAANVMMPAPNPPWGSINPGTEFMVYMSRLASDSDSGKGYPFRFYYNDTWFHSDPWFGYYGAEGFDIQMPLKVTRIGRDGRVEHPAAIHLFSLDDDRGGMHEGQVYEVTGHFYRAFRSLPDEAGPVTWVYPFEELDRTAKERPELLPEVYFHDAYARDVLNQGFPMCTVISSTNFAALTAADCGALRSTILFVAAPRAGTAYADAVLRCIEAGQRTILYGPLDDCDDRLLALLGIGLEQEPLAGELELIAGEAAVGRGGRVWPKRLQHNAVTSAGGIREVLADERDGSDDRQQDRQQHRRLLFEATDGKRSRAYAVEVHSPAGGLSLAWIRGSAGMVRNTFHTDFPEAQLIHAALAGFGYSIGGGAAFDVPPGGRPLIGLISRREGAYRVTGHKPDDTAYAAYELPQGAPLFMNAQALVEGRTATYTLAKTFDYEVRCFVEQREKAVISCTEEQITGYKYRRAIGIRSLTDATVYLLPPRDLPDLAGTLQFRALGGNGDGPAEWPWTFDGTGYRAEGVTGDIEIRW